MRRKALQSTVARPTSHRRALIGAKPKTDFPFISTYNQQRPRISSGKITSRRHAPSDRVEPLPVLRAIAQALIDIVINVNGREAFEKASDAILVGLLLRRLRLRQPRAPMEG